MATAQQLAAAKAKYPQIVDAVNRLASLGAQQPAQTSPEQWMSNWNAQSQANYDAAGPEIMAAANMRRKSVPSRSPVTLGPFPSQQRPKIDDQTQGLATAFRTSKSKMTPRLSPDELAANAAMAKDRRAAEREARFQQKAFSKQARTFKRMAGMGYNDGLIAMPMMSPQDQFAMEMSRAAMQHGNQMDVDQLGLQRQQLDNLDSQFRQQMGLNRTIAGNQFQLGQGELDMRNKLGSRQLDVQSELGNKGYDTQRQLANTQADTARYGYDTQYDVADMEAQLQRSQQAMQAEQFAKQMDRLTRQDDRQHAYNKRDFSQGVSEADRMFQQGSTQADRQHAYRKMELERLNRALQMQGNMQEHEMSMQDMPESQRASLGILAGRPDLQAQMMGGADINDIANKMRNLSAMDRQSIYENTGGDHNAVDQQLRMLGLPDTVMKEEFRRITGIPYAMYKAKSLLQTAGGAMSLATPGGVAKEIPGIVKNMVW